MTMNYLEIERWLSRIASDAMANAANTKDEEESILWQKVAAYANYAHVQTRLIIKQKENADNDQ